MSRFKKLNTFFLVLSMTVLMSCSKTEKPNIILFLVDDMGWQDTSVPFYTERTPFNETYHTPNMERLAAQGMKFTQAYSHSVCSPTRVSLMSGMNAAHHRVTNWTLRRNATNDRPHELLEMPSWNVNGMQPTDSIENAVHVTPLPQILHDHGYFTIHCGKAHFGAIGTPGENPVNLGFDINIAGHAAGGPGSYNGEHNYSAVWRNGSPVWDVPGLEKYHGTNINLTEALTREALLALDSVVKLDQPFFLYMSHYAVHAPIEADKRFIAKYAGMDTIEAKYASMVESMDKSLGDIMDFVEQNGLQDNTIILFTSDNGGLSAAARGGIPHTHNKPLSSGKGSAHEGGIREPMIVSWPGVTEPGSQTDDYLIIEDFFPTILEMANISDYQTVQPIDGHSFTNILHRNPVEKDRPLFWHFPNNWGPTGPGIGASSTIRKGEWKLIYYHANQQFELFNIADDIGELTNLADDRPGIKEALAKELGEYLRNVKAQMPTLKETNQPVPWPDEMIN
jgi:arylsulfatase A-like enzyme